MKKKLRMGEISFPKMFEKQGKVDPMKNAMLRPILCKERDINNEYWSLRIS